MAKMSENNIKKLRLERGLSQGKLGELAGTTGATINRLENGLRGLTLDWMERISSALGVRPLDLLVDDQGKSAASAGNLTLNTELLSECLAAVDEIDRENNLNMTLSHRATAAAQIYAIEVENPSGDIVNQATRAVLKLLADSQVRKLPCEPGI